MKLFSKIAVMILAALLSAGCETEQGRDANLGEMTMSLSSTSPLGVEYRLRNALFRISGPQSMDVSSEDYPPTDTVITVTLASGDYQVYLLDGWSIEHSANGQPFTPIPAILISPSPISATVRADQVTQLTFHFQVDEGVINFGPGTLSIDFDVEEATVLTVFVSDAQVSSNIGGISTADSICQAEADAAGLGGTFRAWLSESGYSPASDWGLAGGRNRFVRPDSVLVATSWEKLVDDTVTHPLLNSINVKADGTLIPSSEPSPEWTVWTGTRADGSAFPGSNCNGWTSIDNSQDTLIGGAVGTARDWTELAPYNCGDYDYRFYCFEQSDTAPQPPVLLDIDHQLVTLNQCGIPNTSTFRYSVDYEDADGDVTPSGTRVFVEILWSTGNTQTYESESQFNSITGNGFAGQVQAINCLAFGSAAYADVTVTIRDDTGHPSNPLTTRVPKPSGAF